MNGGSGEVASYLAETNAPQQRASGLDRSHAIADATLLTSARREDPAGVVVDAFGVRLGTFTGHKWMEISGDFSRAISVVAQVVIDRIEILKGTAESVEPRVVWGLKDSADGGRHWSLIRDTEGNLGGSVGKVRFEDAWDRSDTRRFVEPMASDLTITLRPYSYAGYPDRPIEGWIRVHDAQLWLVVRSLGGIGGRPRP